MGIAAVVVVGVTVAVVAIVAVAAAREIGREGRRERGSPIMSKRFEWSLRMTTCPAACHTSANASMASFHEKIIARTGSHSPST